MRPVVDVSKVPLGVLAGIASGKKRKRGSNTLAPTAAAEEQYDFDLQDENEDDVTQPSHHSKKLKVVPPSILKDADSKPSKGQRKRQRKSATTDPEEVSSKIQPSLKSRVKQLKQNLGARPSRQTRDPRFDPLCGSFNRDHHDAAYSFLPPLTTGVDKAKDPTLYNSLKSREDAMKRSAIQHKVRQEFKRRENKMVKDGEKQKEWHLKKSEEKVLVEAALRQELGAAANPEKRERKRAKKRAAKERHKVFGPRNNGGPQKVSGPRRTTRYYDT